MEESFNLPMPPQGTVFPEPAQLYVTAALGIIAAVFFVAFLYEFWKTRSPLALWLFAGGTLSYLNEPIVDVLALCWHARQNQWVALETFGPAPWWGVGIYTVFFGAMAYPMLLAVRRGIRRRTFWQGVAAFFVVDVACELPIIHFGLYSYYGDPPYLFMGFPLYWLFINTLGPLIVVALLSRAPRFFSGWRQVLVVLLPMTADAAGSLAAGWPIMSALNTPGASAGLKWAAATLTMFIAIMIMDGLARLICVDERQPVAGACLSSPQRGYS